LLWLQVAQARRAQQELMLRYDFDEPVSKDVAVSGLGGVPALFHPVLGCFSAMLQVVCVGQSVSALTCP
jgi:hypothetical protein